MRFYQKSIVFFFLLFGGLFFGFSKSIDFLKATASITIHPVKKQVKGKVVYVVKVAKTAKVITLNAREMQIQRVLVDNKKVDYIYKEDVLQIPITSLEDKDYSITVFYEAYPKKAMYFNGWDALSTAKKQVFTQGQGKYTSHWLPSVDATQDKIIFDFFITFDAKYTVIANGVLKNTTLNNGQKTWHYTMDKPMSSYLVAIAIGDYAKKQLTSSSGIAITTYYYKDKPQCFATTYAYAQKMFAFLEKEIAVDYPWQDYKLVPVQDFLYAGMENTGLTIFSDRYLVDIKSSADNAYVNMQAHELAHHWFGNLVTAKTPKDHWLQEGFATYYALQFEKSIFGTPYYHEKLYQSAKQIDAQAQKGQAESITDPKATSLTYYQKGAWVLHLLEQEIGKRAFKKTIKKYLEIFAFDSATTQDFFVIAQQFTKKDIEAFTKKWVYTKDFSFTDAVLTLWLDKDRYMDEVFAIEQSKWHHPTYNNTPERAVFYKQVVEKTKNVQAKKAILGFLPEKITAQELLLYKDLLQETDIELQKQILAKLQYVPLELQAPIENLLEAPSYALSTRALVLLWQHFPSKRKVYLEQTKVSFAAHPDQYVIWLGLAISTPLYLKNQKALLLAQLQAHTSEVYDMQTRNIAFDILAQLDAFNARTLQDLVDAANYRPWYLAVNAREHLRFFIAQKKYSTLFKTMHWSKTQKAYLEKQRKWIKKNQKKQK